MNVDFRRLRRRRRRPKPGPGPVFMVRLDEIIGDLAFGTGRPTGVSPSRVDGRR